MNENLITKVSNLYRQQQANLTQINSDILEVKSKLLNKSISHEEYLKLTIQLEFLTDEYKKKKYMTEGIFMTRELLFN